MSRVEQVLRLNCKSALRARLCGRCAPATRSARRGWPGMVSVPHRPTARKAAPKGRGVETAPRRLHRAGPSRRPAAYCSRRFRSLRPVAATVAVKALPSGRSRCRRWSNLIRAPSNRSPACRRSRPCRAVLHCRLKLCRASKLERPRSAASPTVLATGVLPAGPPVPALSMDLEN